MNHHPLSSEGNMTPSQIDRRNSTSAPSGPVGNQLPPVQESDTVSVPRSTFTPCPILDHLLSAVDPLQQSSNFGIDIYYQVIGITSQNIQLSCTVCHAD